jgi:hypothetical protein
LGGPNCGTACFYLLEAPSLSLLVYHVIQQRPQCFAIVVDIYSRGRHLTLVTRDYQDALFESFIAKLQRIDKDPRKKAASSAPDYGEITLEVTRVETIMPGLIEIPRTLKLTAYLGIVSGSLTGDQNCILIS